MESLGFPLTNTSGRIMALRSTQPLTEMSTRDISWRLKAAGAWGWQPYYLHVPTIYKFWKPQPCTALTACPGLYRNCCTLTCTITLHCKTAPSYVPVLTYFLVPCGHLYTVGSRFATVLFTTIHSYDSRRDGPSTPDLRCITVANSSVFSVLSALLAFFRCACVSSFSISVQFF